MNRPRCSAQSAFTFIEVMVACMFIGATAAAMTYSLLTMNKFADRERDRSSARQLCQEKLEEALSAPYDPSNNSIPTVLTAGTATDTVRVYVKQDNATIMIPGTRTTVVNTADATTKTLSVTATVTFVHRGRTQAMSMATLRAPD